MYYIEYAPYLKLFFSNCGNEKEHYHAEFLLHHFRTYRRNRVKTQQDGMYEVEQHGAT